MERFEDLITSNIPVLVDFFAEWCGPCKAMKPILEELKGIKGEKVRIVKVDVDKHKEIAAYYQIQSVPTLMIFKDGKQLWRQSGVMRANDLSTVGTIRITDEEKTIKKTVQNKSARPFLFIINLLFLEISIVQTFKTFTVTSFVFSHFVNCIVNSIQVQSFCTSSNTFLVSTST